MAISNKGYNVKCITLEKEDNTNLQINDLVTINGGYAVKSTAGTGFIGVVVGVRENYVTVQIDGYHEAPYTGSLSAGLVRLAAGSAGAVTLDTTTTNTNLARKVIKVDTSTHICGFIL